MTTTNPTPAPLSPEREVEPYRDDVREPLEAAGWRETAEGHVMASNGALWTETNDKLDSGIDAPGKAWSIPFDSGVPGAVIVAAALAASGVDVPAQLAKLAELEAASRQWGERCQARCNHIAKQGMRWKAEADGRKRHGEQMRARVAELEAERQETNSKVVELTVALRAAEKRVAELERPAVEAKRNEVRSSYAELISQCEQDRDYEGAFNVQCRLREREEQWKREDSEGGVR